MSLRTYISGPMSGIEDFNHPAFYKAERELNNVYCDMQFVNPARVVLPPEMEGKPAHEVWVAYMRICIAQLMTCDRIALLPGWENSKGARMELDCAVRLGMPVLYLDGDKPEIARAVQLAKAMAGIRAATVCEADIKTIAEGATELNRLFNENANLKLKLARAHMSE